VDDRVEKVPQQKSTGDVVDLDVLEGHQCVVSEDQNESDQNDKNVFEWTQNTFLGYKDRY
jgi:hypothetical protein